MLFRSPDHQPLPHLEDVPGMDSSSAEANASIDATDAGSVLEAEPTPAAAG